jgi:G3E family GTPase
MKASTSTGKDMVGMKASTGTGKVMVGMKASTGTGKVMVGMKGTMTTMVMRTNTELAPLLLLVRVTVSNASLCLPVSLTSLYRAASTKYGIDSFVYSRRRPFHPKRLLEIIFALPVKVDPATGEFADDWSLPDVSSVMAESHDVSASSVMRAVIRSKGFVWVANQHSAAQYWSHAGHFFELRALGLLPPVRNRMHCSYSS